MRCRVVVVAAVALAAWQSAPAQFKSQVEAESRVVSGLGSAEAPTLFFGWFDPSRFQMRHMVDFSFQSFGGRGGMSVGTYTNSMTYDVADNLRARADVSMSYVPYNSFAPPGTKAKDLSAIYLSRAEISYKPWENMLIQVQYRQLPYGSPYYSPFFNPWYREGPF